MIQIDIVENQHTSEILNQIRSKPELEFDPIINDKLEAFNQCIDTILANKIEAIILPIKWIPPGGSPLISIAGLLDRPRPGISINYKPSQEPANHLIKLHKNSLIACDDYTVMAQLKNILPEFEYVLHDQSKPTDSADIQGYVFLYSNIDTDRLETFSQQFTFNPKELIPPAGEYVYAMMCQKENEPIHLKLSQLNNPEVSRVSNIERRVLKELTSRGYSGIHVYCECDTLQNYHLFVACLDEAHQLMLGRYSSGISYGMESEILDLLSPVI